MVEQSLFKTLWVLLWRARIRLRLGGFRCGLTGSASDFVGFVVVCQGLFKIWWILAKHT